MKTNAEVCQLAVFIYFSQVLGIYEQFRSAIPIVLDVRYGCCMRHTWTYHYICLGMSYPA